MKLNGVRSFIKSLLSGTRYGQRRGAKRRQGERVGRAGEVCEQRVLLTVDLTLLRDNNAAAPTSLTSTRNYMTVADNSGNIYFGTQDGVHGHELWTSDGTIAGTHLVKDIAPGMASSNPIPLGIVNNQLLFWGNDPVHGSQLWLTDGTEAGTVMLTNVPGLDCSSANEFKITGNKLYTEVYDPVHSWEMWVSDGTSAGTFMTGDVSPGSGDSWVKQITDVNGTVYYAEQSGENAPSKLYRVDPVTGQSALLKDVSPSSMSNVNGTLYFGVGDQLWKSNGTTSGTVLVKDFNTTGGLGVTLYGALGSLAVFTIDDGVHGNELWVSNGTEAGTHLVKDIIPGSGSLVLKNPVIANGKLYFGTDDGVHGNELWVTSGTAGGTAMLADISPGAAGTSLDQVVAAGSTVYFRAGGNLWKTNGNVAGTSLVKDFEALGAGIVGVPNSLQGKSSLIAIGDKVAFQVDDGVHGAHYWVSDGTDAGTFALQSPSDEVSYVFTTRRSTFPAASNGRLFFETLDAAQGFDLWSSDLTAAGTHNLGNIDVRTADMLWENGFRWSSGSVGNTFYYTTGRELWKSDGTSAGTVLVKGFGGTLELLPPVTGIGGVTSLGGVLVFTVDDGIHGVELWQSDGTDSGTVMIKDIQPGAAGSRPGNFQLVNGVLYFTADDGTNGLELWKSDGTGAGTVLVKDTIAGATGMESFTPLGVDGSGIYYFAVKDSEATAKLWKSDGTGSGTQVVASVSLGQRGIGTGAFLNGAFYFAMDDGVHGAQLWKLATASGAMTMLTNLDEANGYGVIPSEEAPQVLNGKVIFKAFDSTHGLSPWVSDGTPAGTVSLIDFPMNRGIAVNPLISSGGQVYFTADDGVHGQELWRTDGTVTGTRLVKDINLDDSNSSGPMQLVDVSGSLYFFNTNDINSRTNDLWKTDGTAAGTVRVLSSNSFVGPLIAWSGFTQTINVNGLAFIQFDDMIHGREWWSTRLVAESAGAFRNGTFYLDADNSGGWNSGGSVQSFSGGAVFDKQFSFGIAGDIPVTGDWNGDEAQEVGVFRNGIWYLDQNGNYKWNGVAGGDVTFSFGTAGDTPITGDWNGDGITDVGVVRNGAWYLDMNGNHKWDSGTDAYFKFGNAGDKPVTGDWNGDGTTEIGVFRGATWYLDMDGNRKWNAGDVSFNFGTAGDIPVTGDWNGDLKTDVGVFRNGFYYVDKDANRKWSAGDVKFGFGNATDTPLSGTWNLKIPAASPPAAAPAALVVQIPEQATAANTMAVETTGSVSKFQVKGHAKKHAHKGKS